MSAPAMPMPPDPPSPGPGSYQIVDYKGPSKKFMSRNWSKVFRLKYGQFQSFLEESLKPTYFDQ